MTACQSCGTENPTGQRFCGSCGTALAVTCGTCGAPIPRPALLRELRNAPGHRRVDAVRCSRCGAGDRATARFGALCRSRRIHDALGVARRGGGAGAPFSLLRHLPPVDRAVRRHRREVHRRRGDGGVGDADRDRRRCRARRTGGARSVAAVSALGQEVGAENLRARAGVLTGEAAVNLAAVGEGMVAGDVVNTASRIQSAAEPGSVLVGEATRRATEQAIVYEDAGSFELKGKEGEARLWKALRVVSGVRGQLKSQGLEAPFAGRDRELRQIKDLFHICADERKAHLVSVTGIAGIGKSRLAWEFYKYFDGIAQIDLLASRPVSRLRRGRHLLGARGHGADAVPDRRGRRSADRPGEAGGRARGAHPRRGRAAFVQPRLAQLLGLGEQEARDRQDLFAAWRLFFERLATSTRRCSRSRTCSGRTPRCSTSSSTCSSGRGTTRST